MTNFNRFSTVFCIDATSRESIESDLRDISKAKNPARPLEDACTWLATQKKNWLVLFDNADDAHLDLRQYIPRCLHGNILVTTSNKDLTTHARGTNSSYQVSSLPLEDAKELLVRLSGLETSVVIDEQATALVKVVQVSEMFFVYELTDQST